MKSAESKVVQERRKKPEQLHETHPAHPVHHDHPDNHKHRAHHPHARLIQGILAVFFFVTLVIMVFSGYLTDAPFGNVVLSFSPALLLALFGAALLHSDHFDIRYLAFAFFLVLVVITTLLTWLAAGVDVMFVTGMNLFLGLLLLLIISNSERAADAQHGEVVEVGAQQQDLTAVFEEIVEKSKTINIAIGRVYHQRDGGTEALRKKIRIDSGRYNELSMDKKPDALREHLLEIMEKLEELAKPERDVLTTSEMDKLTIEHRDETGRTRVINVLAENEGENVFEAYAILEEYVRIALEKLVD